MLPEAWERLWTSAMAASHTISAEAKKDNPRRLRWVDRCNFALQKNLCVNRSEWRLLPGKPPERLSPYYQLVCEFGTSVMTSWAKDGNEPVYVCEEHAKELASGFYACV